MFLMEHFADTDTYANGIEATILALSFKSTINPWFSDKDTMNQVLFPLNTMTYCSPACLDRMILLIYLHKYTYII